MGGGVAGVAGVESVESVAGVAGGKRQVEAGGGRPWQAAVAGRRGKWPPWQVAVATVAGGRGRRPWQGWQWPWQVAVAGGRWPWQVAVPGGRGRWPCQACHLARGATGHLPRPPATCHTCHLPPATCHGHRPSAHSTCHTSPTAPATRLPLPRHTTHRFLKHTCPSAPDHLLRALQSLAKGTCSTSWFHFWSFPNLFLQSGLAQLGYFLGAHFGNEATWKRVILEPTFHPKIMIRLVRSSWHWLPALKI